MAGSNDVRLSAAACPDPLLFAELVSELGDPFEDILTTTIEGDPCEVVSLAEYRLRRARGS